MTEIKQLTAQLYARLGVGSRPRSTEARLLEQIDLAAEVLDARVGRLRRLVWAYAGDDDYEFDAAVTDCKAHGDLPETTRSTTTSRNLVR
jgi:hypothetical protein